MTCVGVLGQLCVSVWRTNDERRCGVSVRRVNDVCQCGVSVMCVRVVYQ